MRTRLTSIVSMMLCIVLLSGCGNSIKPQTHKMPAIPDYSSEMTLGEYHNLTFDLDEGTYIVNEEVIKDAIYMTYYSSITAQDIGDKEIVNGDIVTLKINCTINGSPVYWTDKNDYTLGQHSKSEYFDKYIIGHKIGDSISFDVKYPDTYSDMTYQGQTAHYEMEILGAKTKRVTIDDTFAMTYTPYHTSQELCEAFEASLKETSEQLRKQEIFRQYMNQIIESSEFKSLPNLEGIKSDINTALATTADQLGISDSEYRMLYLGATDAEYETWLTETATEYIETRMVICEIARRENLTVSQEEYDDYVNEFLSNYGVNSLDDVQSSSNTAEEALIDLLSNKVMDFLAEKNQ